MSEFEIIVIWGGVVAVFIIGAGSVFAFLVAIKTRNELYLEAHQEFLEQKKRVKKILINGHT